MRMICESRLPRLPGLESLASWGLPTLATRTIGTRCCLEGSWTGLSRSGQGERIVSADNALGSLDSVVVVVVEACKDLGHVVLLVTVRNGNEPA